MLTRFLILSINISTQNKKLSSALFSLSQIVRGLMEEAKVIQGKGDQTNFSFQEKQPSLQIFPKFSVEKQTSKQTHVSDPEPDLNLRLSVGEVYNTKQNPLTRSSSIAGEAVNSEKKFMEHLENTFPKSTYLSLARSSSLPVEMKTGKRVVNMKELRLMRRVEAKKRAEEKHKKAMKGTDVPRFPTENPANKAIGKIKESSSEGVEGSENPNPGPEITASEATAESENPTKKAKLWFQENGMITLLARTFSVTTTGDGPNGRKIDGVLHGYENGQVTLECGCHGHVLSPEEFVKHAGGIVTNAMNQIYIFPSSFYY